MRKIFKRNTSFFIAILLCFSLFSISAFATDTSAEDTSVTDSTTEDDPFVNTAAGTSVIFTNEPNTNPDLFITKTVSNPTSATLPDDIFTFYIKVGGSAYANEYYTVSSDGTNYSQYDSDNNAYQTDRYGRFYLKDGQTARFEYIGNNVSYEVTEEEMTDYSTNPASGVISGYTGEVASSITFTNTYTPPSTPDTPGNSNLTTELYVYKYVTFPSNLTPPASDTFTFALTIDGELYTGEKYYVYNTSTGQNTGSNFTDGNGQFTLNPDQYAVFSDIPVNVDYNVTEVFEDGAIWRAVGKSSISGSTSYPRTQAEFTNTQVSFAVSKQLSGGDSAAGIPFTFYLTNAANQGVANAQYYLYSSGGYQVDEDIHTTGTGGFFTLESDQIAVFIGLPSSITYNVSESVADGFVQVSPGSDGYTGIVVSDSAVTYPFINTVEETPGMLTVMKVVENAGEYSASSEDEFTFRLTYVNTVGTAISTGIKSDEVYKLYDGNTEYSYKTSDTGCFTLKAGQRAVFTALPLNEEYIVEELTSGLNQSYSISQPSQEATLTSEGVSMIFTNIYNPTSINLNIVKVDADDTSKTLEGVSFTLYGDENLTVPIDTKITDSEGKLTFEGLVEGTWYLNEDATIETYALPKNPWVITITDTEGTLSATISENGSVLETSDGSEGDTETESTPASVTVQLENGRSWMAILPETGGRGTLFLYIGAVVLIAVGIGLYIIKKKRIKK